MRSWERLWGVVGGYEDFRVEELKVGYEELREVMRISGSRSWRFAVHGSWLRVCEHGFFELRSEDLRWYLPLGEWEDVLDTAGSTIDDALTHKGLSVERALREQGVVLRIEGRWFSTMERALRERWRDGGREGGREGFRKYACQ
jgi:hypothetical protein